MPHPKEKIAHQHELELIDWLRLNQRLLPLSLYAISRKLDWSFGALRGTILRINNRPAAENPLVLREFANPTSKRFIIYIALKGTASESKLDNEILDQTGSDGKNQNKPFLPELQSRLITYLNKLVLIDDKVIKLASEITDTGTLDKFIEYQFGLEQREKVELKELIEILEGM